MACTLIYSHAAAAEFHPYSLWPGASIPAVSTGLAVTSNRQGLRPDQAQPGTVVWFSWDNVGTTSMAYGQLNAGAGNHPVVIYATKDGGNISCCLPATSFKQSTIQDRYATHKGRNFIFRQYLAIEHYGSTVPHNDRPIIHTNNRFMRKQSYVSLDGYFEIETKYLTEWENSTAKLTESSLSILRSEYEVFCSNPRLASPRRRGSEDSSKSPAKSASIIDDDVDMVQDLRAVQFPVQPLNIEYMYSTYTGYTVNGGLGWGSLPPTQWTGEILPYATPYVEGYYSQPRFY